VRYVNRPCRCRRLNRQINRWGTSRQIPDKLPFLLSFLSSSFSRCSPVVASNRIELAYEKGGEKHFSVQLKGFGILIVRSSPVRRREEGERKGKWYW